MSDERWQKLQLAIAGVPPENSGPALPGYMRWGLPFLVVFLFRIPYFGVENLNSDEGLYSLVARAMQQDGLPYRDAWDHAAPGVFYLYRFVFGIFGAWAMGGVRWAALLAHACSAWIAGTEIRRRHGDIPGLAAAVLMAIAIGGYLPADSIAAITETFLLPPLLLAFWQLLRWVEDKPHSIILAAVGIALATWFKIHAVLISFLLIGGVVVIRFYSGKKLLDSIVHGLKILFAAGGFYLILVGPLFLSGGFYDYMRMYIQYNLFYFGAGQYGTLFFYGLWRTMWQWMLPQYLVVALAAIPLILVIRNANSKDNDRSKLLLLSICFGLLVGVMGGRLFGHYFIPAAGFMAYAAGEGISWCYINLRNLWETKSRPFVYSGAVLIFLGILMPITYFHGEAYDSRFRAALGGGIIAQPFPHLVQAVQQTVQPNEKIWVWGFAPELYVHTQRDCASRFINCNYLVGLVPWVNAAPDIDTTPLIVPGSWEALREDLMREPPSAIIDASASNYQFWGKYPLNGHEALRNFVQQGYVDVGMFDGFRLHLRNDIAARAGIENDNEPFPPDTLEVPEE